MFPQVKSSQDCLSMVDTIYESCFELGPDECIACLAGDTCKIHQQLLNCSIIVSQCQTRTDCVNSGYCQGQEPLLPQPEKPFYGACAFPKLVQGK